MKLSLNWLRRYVDLPESVAEISSKLTAVGLEVEGVEDHGAAYAGIIVAKVLHREKHPDSDHLSVTRVFDGKEELQVVCGAPNVAAGQTVAFAPLGVELPLPDGKSLKMKKAKIRGVESNGMICAVDEIGLGTSHDGILVLSDALAAGTTLASLGYYDVSLEVNVTPNRPDALCHIGVARELAAAFERPLKLPLANLSESGDAVTTRVRLDVAPECGCTRYVGRVIEGVKVGPSPEWMQRLLTAAGITPISNVVDVTNFVLLEWNQPLHSFDLDRLAGGMAGKGSVATIGVRRARAGESIETIDHKVYHLAETDLATCDGDRPACVAGVMGGVESEITEATTRVFLESAWFDPGVVRKQSKRLGLSSDSSYRFERSIDPSCQAEVCAYAAALIAELGSGHVLSGQVEFTSPAHKVSAAQVALRPSRVKAVVGLDVPADRVRHLLGGIGLAEVSSTAESITFSIPPWRPDLEREVDLVEEVARLVGLDAVPMDFPVFRAEVNPLPAVELLSRNARHALAAMGLYECLSLRFSSKAAVAAVFGPEGEDPRTRPAALVNPLSEELGVLPVSLVPRLLQSASDNLKNRQLSVRLFEVGKAQFPHPEQRSDRDPGFEEKPIVTAVVASQWETEPSAAKPRSIDFSDAKGLALALLQRLHVRPVIRVPEKPEVWLHPGRQAELVVDGRVLGVVGEVHPQVADRFGISVPVCAFEISLDAVLAAAAKRIQFQPFARTMAVTRDLSLEVDARATHESALATIKSIGAKHLVSVELKTWFQGPPLPEGRKNLVYTFVYQHPDSSLTDEDVNKAQERIRSKLAQEPGFVIR